MSIVLWLLSSEAFYLLGNAVWNFMISLVSDVAAETPETFSRYVWAYVTGTVQEWTFLIGSSLLNIMFLVGIIRHTANLRESFTLEIFVETMMKVVFGNLLMLNGNTLMKELFAMAAGISKVFLTDNPPSFTQQDQDLGSAVFYLVFGIIYLLVALVCSTMIFITVYSRYLYLYLLVAVGPVAWATLPGGPGVSSTASAWIRTFLAKCFEIVVIALAISIAAAMCREISFGDLDGIGEIVDGAAQSVQNLFTMIILTGSVKTADFFMRRTFGL